MRISNHPTTSITFGLKPHAIQWVKEKEIQIQKREIITGYKPRKETLGNILDRYLNEITSKKKSPQVEAVKIRRLISDPISKVHCQNMTSIHVINFRMSDLKKVTSGTTLKDLSLLKHTITIAKTEWGYPIAANPVSGIKKPKQNPPRDR